MSRASLRNEDQNPFLYLEGATGSTAFGVNAAASDIVNLITSDAVQNLDPSSGTIAAGTASISIGSTVNGNIEFCPKGSGQSTFARGDVAITGAAGTAGNLLMNNTPIGGLSGVINFGGSRFIHNRGNQNTFIGEVAGNLSNTGTSNTVIGASSTSLITTASSNIIIGASSCPSLTTASNNIVIGNSAMTSASSASTSNIVIGNSTLNDATSADLNIAVGHGALDSLITGDTNIAIGINAGNAFTGAESNNITIGHLGVVADSGVTRIGTSGTQTSCFISGIVGTSVTSVGSVVVDASGQMGTSSILPGAFPYTDETSSPIAIVANNGYTANLGSLLTFNMPATVAYGSVFKIVGKGAGLWSVVLSGGQTIKFGILSGTTSISSTLQYDNVEILCITADTLFEVVGSTGNLTVL